MHLPTDARDLQPSLITWRRHLHAHPELSYREHATATFVRERLCPHPLLAC